MSDYPLGTYDEGREVTHEDIKQLVRRIRELESKLALAEKAIADSKEQTPFGYVSSYASVISEVKDEHYTMPLFASPIIEKEKI